MVPVNENKELLSIAANRYVEEAHFAKPFNLTVESLKTDSARMKFDMHDGLRASSRNPNLQGGAIATVLDIVGSLVVFSHVIPKIKGETVQEKIEKMESGMLVEGKGIWRMSTIDLRIDYLRPGRGKSFIADARILRIGSKVAVTRMELHNDDKKLIAVGTGTYIVG